MTLINFTKLPILRYLGICNVLYIWHIRVIPTLESTDNTILCLCIRLYHDIVNNYLGLVDQHISYVILPQVEHAGL